MRGMIDVDIEQGTEDQMLMSKQFYSYKEVYPNENVF